jgi:hypothetical protein
LLSDEKILITGPAGRIAFGMAESLVGDNEVWGIARFSDPSTREKVESLGVTTRAADIASGRFGDLPSDFTYLLHIAADFSATDYERSLTVNAEGTGLILVNWGGDEPVSVQQWSAYLGELFGIDAKVVVDEVPGASIGSVGDHHKRAAITGPCRVHWRDGIRRVAEQLYPNLVRSADVG